MLKLFIVLRADLKPGLMIPQACHAQDAFYDWYPELYEEWRTKYKNLIVKDVADEAALEALRERVQKVGVACASYNEEDLNHSLTGIAFYGEGAKRLVAALPLALQAA